MLESFNLKKYLEMHISYNSYLVRSVWAGCNPFLRLFSLAWNVCFMIVWNGFGFTIKQKGWCFIRVYQTFFVSFNLNQLFSLNHNLIWHVWWNNPIMKPSVNKASLKQHFKLVPLRPVWGGNMTGQRKNNCKDCRLHIYNLSY